MRGISILQTDAVAHPSVDGAAALLRSFHQVRRATEKLCAPLSPEDQMVQSCAEASPVKWHLAHTSWFFETFVLREFLPGYREFHPDFAWLFNSYYRSLGEHPEKKLRSSFSRPANSEIQAYRAHVEAAIASLLETPDVLEPDARAEALHRIEMGLHHEQQHQELIATDIKHALWTNPLRPSYADALPRPPAAPPAPPPPPGLTTHWIGHPGGLVDIGHQGDGFGFDNESPRHTVFLQPFQLASRPVTCGEYLAFMQDGGYSRPELWLSEGWDTMRAEGWKAPLYWEHTPSPADGGQHHKEPWRVYTLRGTLPVAALERTPVCSVSYFEADAYAHWYALRHPGARLPTEAEWETAAESLPVEGNLLESGCLHPRSLDGDASIDSERPHQMFGDVWEWTHSAYLGYPGYVAPTGALGEYNGKFMSGNMVLRGGSCATPTTHDRASYRNFFHPATRWQFSGIRLARLLPPPATRL